MYWKAWFVPATAAYPNGITLIANVSEDRIDHCLEFYPDDILFEAELVTDQPDYGKIKIVNDPPLNTLFGSGGGQGSRVGDTDYG